MSSLPDHSRTTKRKSTLHIVLFDVSASMQAPLKLRSNAQNADKETVDLDPKRVQSVFDVICRLAEDGIANTKSQDMYAAVLAFGLVHVNTCDLLAFLEDRAKALELLDSANSASHADTELTYEQVMARLVDVGMHRSEATGYIQESGISSLGQPVYVIDGHAPLIKLLASAGAPYCDQYVQDHLDAQRAGKYFLAFSAADRRSELSAIVDRLPDACKSSFSLQRFATEYTGDLGRAVAGMAASTAIDHAESLLPSHSSTSPIRYRFNPETGETNVDPRIVSVLRSMPTATPQPLAVVLKLIKRLKSAAIQGRPAAHTSHVNWERLLDDIEPYLYGYTPMCEALSSIRPLVSRNSYSSKVLVLISDGDATDGDPLMPAAIVRSSGATIFACLLTDSIIEEPRRIRSEHEEDENWTSAALAMFRMASSVSHDSTPVHALRRRGWKLPAAGMCKLFIQANNPLVIDEFTAASQSLGTSSDALASLVGEVSLDAYIYRVNTDAKATDQGGRAICWAHATATVIHLASSRVVGRVVPNFFDIRLQLLKLFGDNDDGASVRSALKKICPEYRLKFERCNEEDAVAAIQARRPVVVTFGFHDSLWDCFSNFYKSNPKGILTAQDMAVSPRGDIEGHAAVLVRCDDHSLTFMNSWGPNFGNNGFFTVDKASTLEVPGGPRMRFYDIYWTTADLTSEEIAAWKEHESRTMGRMIGELPVSIHELPVDCPHCKRSAPARNYDGSWNSARCRGCNQTFAPTVQALIQSLYHSNFDH